jgi:hypothetical protein
MIFEDHKVYVTVIFHTTKLTRQGSNLPIKISAVKWLNTQLLSHLENATNTTIKDLNYGIVKKGFKLWQIKTIGRT